MESETIKLIKPDIIIYYNHVLKYPVCVIEQFKDGFINTGIKRKDYGDPFKEDPDIPINYSLTLKDYENYIEYGGSYGHNAPAGFHKISSEAYVNTFLLTNISPQESVFNSGRWLLLEAWTRNIIDKYLQACILTGNIKGENKKFNDSVLNIPSYMYKIVIICANDKYYGIAYMMPNKTATDGKPLNEFMLPISKLSNILKKIMNFDIYKRINKLTKNAKLYELTELESPNITITNSLKQNMKSSKLYGKLIYAKTLNDLEITYKEGLQKKLIGQYHQRAYDTVKKRLTK
jgi:DNA/RNA endonuclease G (NUC1)